MTHIVTDSCIACKYTDCVTVCPVDCFHEGINFLVINPEECIDCGLCVAECPVHAIKTEHDLLKKEHIFVQLNYSFSKLWPVINIKKEPLHQCESMAKIDNKLHLGLLKK